MPRAGLTRERVVDAAAEIADEVGLDDVTFARLAERLGVRQPSLYKHVSGVDAVRTGIATTTLHEVADRLATATIGRSGSDALAALCNAYRAYAHEHQGRYAALARAPDGDVVLREAATRVLDIVLAVLSGYGLDGDSAVDATRAVRAALHGFVGLEAGGGFGLPHDVDRSFKRLVRGLDSALRTWDDQHAAGAQRR